MKAISFDRVFTCQARGLFTMFLLHQTNRFKRWQSQGEIKQRTTVGHEHSRSSSSGTVFGRNIGLGRITPYSHLCNLSQPHSTTYFRRALPLHIIRHHRPLNIITRYPTEPTSVLWEKSNSYNSDLPQEEQKRSPVAHQCSHGNLLPQGT